MNAPEMPDRLQSRPKLAAEFADRTAAESAAESIRTRLDDDDSSVTVVAPAERASDLFDRKVGARSGVVRDQLLVSHAVLGAAGMLGGALMLTVAQALLLEVPPRQQLAASRDRRVLRRDRRAAAGRPLVAEAARGLPRVPHRRSCARRPVARGGEGRDPRRCPPRRAGRT